MYYKNSINIIAISLLMTSLALDNDVNEYSYKTKIAKLQTLHPSKV